MPTALKRNRFGRPGFLHKLEPHLVFTESQTFQELIIEGPGSSHQLAACSPGRESWAKVDLHSGDSFARGEPGKGLCL